jgi:two-component system, probable response regulator PhcQ
MQRILIVDDAPQVLAALRRVLRRRWGERIAVELFDDPALALGRARQCRFDVVISDLRMPGLDGLALLTLMSAVQPASVRLMLTASADFAAAQRAVNEAAVFRYICKPWQDTELLAHLEAALQEAARLRAAEATG